MALGLQYYDNVHTDPLPPIVCTLVCCPFPHSKEQKRSHTAISLKGSTATLTTSSPLKRPHPCYRRCPTMHRYPLHYDQTPGRRPFAVSPTRHLHNSCCGESLGASALLWQRGIRSSQPKGTLRRHTTIHKWSQNTLNGT